MRLVARDRPKPDTKVAKPPVLGLAQLSVDEDFARRIWSAGARPGPFSIDVTLIAEGCVNALIAHGLSTLATTGTPRLALRTHVQADLIAMSGRRHSENSNGL
jgi:hypothetical protein